MDRNLYSYDNQYPKFNDTVFIAPGAKVIGNVELGDYVSVWFNAVIRADVDYIKIGPGTNIQDGCVVHEDPGYPAVVGNNVTVGHLAVLHGCTVGDEAVIGMGAVILTGAKIGAGAVVAAGALVPEGREIPPGTLAIGSPAKVVRELTPEYRERFKKNAQHYLELAEKYRRNLK